MPKVAEDVGVERLVRAELSNLGYYIPESKKYLSPVAVMETEMGLPKEYLDGTNLSYAAKRAKEGSFVAYCVVKELGDGLDAFFDNAMRLLCTDRDNRNIDGVLLFNASESLTGKEEQEFNLARAAFVERHKRDMEVERNYEDKANRPIQYGVSQVLDRVVFVPIRL